MEVELVEITVADVDIFDKTEYSVLSAEKRLELIECSNLGVYSGKFFKFYLIKDGKTPVGVLNVCGVSADVVSVAPEIFLEFRGKGYAFLGLIAAYKKCVSIGFKTASAGIRADNTASRKLHEKLGFDLVKTYKSKSGKEMVYYLKPLKYNQ